MPTFIDHITHPELFYQYSGNNEFNLNEYKLNVDLFEGPNALDLDVSVKINNPNDGNNHSSRQSDYKYLFPLALFNSLRGAQDKVELNPKKDKAKILNYIEKAHQYSPEILKDFSIMCFYLNYKYVYILDKLIELNYINLNQHFDYEYTIKRFIYFFGYSPLMIISDAKVVEHLLTHYTVDFNLTHGGKALFSKYESIILNNYPKDSYIYKTIKKDIAKLDGLNLFQQTVKCKQNKKMEVLKKFIDNFDSEEDRLLEKLLNEKSISKQYIYLNQAIYSNNQEVLNNLTKSFLKPVLNHAKGVKQINLLSRAVEQDNTDYVKGLIATGYYDKKQTYAQHNVESLLEYAIRNGFNQSAKTLFSESFYPDDCHHSTFIRVAARNQEMMAYFYEKFPQEVKLKELFLSKNEHLFNEYITLHSKNVKELKSLYYQYEYYLMYAKNHVNRIIYHSIYTKMLIQALSILFKGGHFPYSDFESYITNNFVKNRRGFLQYNISRNVDEEQIIRLYAAVKSIIPSKAQSFFNLAISLCPDNKNLVKFEKKQLEEFLFEERQIDSKSTNIKRIKI